MSSDNGGIIGVVNDPTSTVASGVWQQEEQYEAKVNGTWPQRALFTTNSARFETNTYLNKASTSSTSGNTKTFTMSFWIKRASLATGNNQFPISFYQDSNSRISIAFLTDNTFIVYAAVSGVDKMNFTTNKVFRDTSAWYHIVIAVDTTQSTESNRVKIYVNGLQESSFSTATYPSQNQDLTINTNIYVGTYDTSNNFLSGYLAEFVYIDGTALDQTSFGVANSDGVWTPIPYTGTFGTNGFNLQFENAAALGEDSSGNDNDFTVNNLTSIDQSTDYPVVNFATLNPLTFSEGTLSQGNLEIDHNGSAGKFCASTFEVSQGKWYFEAKLLNYSSNSRPGIGLAQSNNSFKGIIGANNNYALFLPESGTYESNGGNSVTGISVSPASNDIFMFAIDLDNLKFYVGKNNSWFSSQNPSAGSNGYTIAVSDSYAIATGANDLSSDSGRNNDWQFNFGSPIFAITSGNQDPSGYGNFEYAVPSSYYSLNTKNLAEFG